MVKEIYNNTGHVFYVSDEKGLYYLVILERIKNDANGNPRFEARIIPQAIGTKGAAASDFNTFVIIRRFTGHYSSLKEEAEFIVNYR